MSVVRGVRARVRVRGACVGVSVCGIRSHVSGDRRRWSSVRVRWIDARSRPTDRSEGSARARSVAARAVGSWGVRHGVAHHNTLSMFVVSHVRVHLHI